MFEVFPVFLASQTSQIQPLHDASDPPFEYPHSTHTTVACAKNKLVAYLVAGESLANLTHPFISSVFTGLLLCRIKDPVSPLHFNGLAGPLSFLLSPL